MLNAMSPYLLLGFLVAGVMHVYMPKQTFKKYLSNRGFRSVWLAALFGVPLPLCSCGVIPTAMSLKKEGASDGATVSFLIATPQTGVDSIMATYALLGVPFAIIRPVIALIVGLIGGVVVDKFSDTCQSSIDQKEVNSCCNHKISDKKGFVDIFRYGFIDMLQDLGKWLVVGLVVAAAITVFVPESIFELFAGNYFLNILVVLALSIPMYICSTGSIPIALSLLLKGISPGAAVVFLMAGPATNVATLAVVKKVLGAKTTVLYLLSIIIGAILSAMVIDFVLPTQWFISKLSALNICGGCEVQAAWWQTASTILFVLLLINAYVLKFYRRNSVAVAVSEPSSQSFKVVGMRCNHCKTNVERAIVALDNVISVTIDLTNGSVEVEGSVSKEDVIKSVKQLGFDIDSLS